MRPFGDKKRGFALEFRCRRGGAWVRCGACCRFMYLNPLWWPHRVKDVWWLIDDQVKAYAFGKFMRLVDVLEGREDVLFEEPIVPMWKLFDGVRLVERFGPGPGGVREIVRWTRARVASERGGGVG